LARYTFLGSLDSTFGTGGKVITHIDDSDPYSYGLATELVVQTDGKIIAVGYVRSFNTITNSYRVRWAVIRYNSNGQLDFTFGTGGKVITDLGVPNSNYMSTAEGIAIQSNGKYIVVGSLDATGNNDERFAVVRYNTDGTLDNTFGNLGQVSTQIDWRCYATAVTIQPDGKIIAIGSSEYYDSNGVFVSRFAIARYNTNGGLDNTFDGNGIRSIAIDSFSRANAVVLLSGGRILVGGESVYEASKNRFTLVSFNSDGSVDLSFDGNGVRTLIIDTSASITGLALQSDGKIIANGFSYYVDPNNNYITKFALARFNPNGSSDNLFDGNGVVQTNLGGCNACASYAGILQSDGKIVLAGWARDSATSCSQMFALTRYLVQ